MYRPAAIDQLVKLGEKIEVDVYRSDTERHPVAIVEQGLAYGRSVEADTVIVDTAGRLQVMSLLSSAILRMDG